MAPMSVEYRQELARSLTLRENILITLSTVTPASSVFIIIPSLIGQGLGHLERVLETGYV